MAGASTPMQEGRQHTRVAAPYIPCSCSPQVAAGELHDGCCCVMRLSQVASSSIPDGSSVAGHRLRRLRRFEDLFWETWDSLGWSLAAADHGVTYCFELTGPDNPIILMYDTPGLTLLAARRLGDGVELDAAEVASAAGWGVVASTPVACVQDVLDLIGAAGRLQVEGYVVRHPASGRCVVEMCDCFPHPLSPLSSLLSPLSSLASPHPPPCLSPTSRLQPDFGASSTPLYLTPPTHHHHHNHHNHTHVALHASLCCFSVLCVQPVEGEES